MTYHLLRGDARRIPLADGCVQCVVTSPPYWNLRDYGVPGQLGLEPTPEAYVANMVAVFREVRRVLREDGVCWMNLGDSYAAGGKGGGGSFMAERADGAWHHRSAVNGWRPPPPGLKPKDLVGIPWRVAFALQADGWYLRSDIIWCLSPSTLVYAKTATTQGPMSVHDLVRLDPATVKLWTGEKWSQVTHWEKTYADRPLRMWLRSGETISCTAEHHWPLADGRVVPAGELCTGDVLATTDLPDAGPGPNMPEDLAWFAGLYLAEGSMSDDAIQIAGHTKESVRHERLRSVAEKYGGTFVIRHDGNNASAVVHGDILHGAIRHFVTGKLASGKHLHPRAWGLPSLVLRAFLLGYLDGDGHHDAKNDRWRLGFCANHAWANDLRTLAARLGATLTLTPGYAKMGKTRTFECYRGELRWNHSEHHNRKARSEIIKIGPAPRGNYYDIGIEDEPHLFALASGVLTHNSKPNPMPESVTDRPTKSHEYIFLLTKSPKYFYDAEAVKEEQSPGTFARFGDGRASRKTTRKAIGCEAGEVRSNASFKDSTPDAILPNGRNRRSVWHIPTQSWPESHFATFPEALVEPCILAGTSEKGCCPVCGKCWERVTEKKRVPTRSGNSSKVYVNPEGSPYEQHSGSIVGNRDPFRHCTATVTQGFRPACTCNAGAPVPCLVLDPFNGSGTSGAVAVRHGRRYVGLDLSGEYIEMATRRIGKAARPGTFRADTVSDAPLFAGEVG